jgi:hypothetical protein
MAYMQRSLVGTFPALGIEGKNAFCVHEPLRVLSGTGQSWNYDDISYYIIPGSHPGVAWMPLNAHNMKDLNSPSKPCRSRMMENSKRPKRSVGVCNKTNKCRADFSDMCLRS